MYLMKRTMRGIRKYIDGKTHRFLEHTFLLITAASVLVALDTQPREGVIVSGIYIEEVEDSPLMTYETLVPIVFEFKINTELVPSTSNGPEPRIVSKFVCRNDARVPGWQNTSPCPVFFHMNNLLTQLKTNFTDNFFNANFNNRARFSAENFQFTNRYLFFEECESHLRSLMWTGINVRRDTGLAEYRITIERCAAASYFEENIPDFAGNISLSNGIYEKMRDNFLSAFNDTTDGTSVAMFTAIQSLLTLNSYSEISRWREAMASCQNNFIPYSLVKVARLEKALAGISEQLASKRFNKLELSTTMGQLYQLPISDCIFGTKSLYVRILIPVKRASKIYKPLRIIQPQFLYDTETCWINSKDSGTRLSQINLLHEVNSKELMETKCDVHNAGFCRVSSGISTALEPTDKCISTVVASSSAGFRDKNMFNEMRKACGIQCEVINSTSKVTFPIVQQVGSNKFIVTTNVISPLLIKCETFGLADQVIHPQKYGATEITLPCGCYLMLHSDKYYPSKPCSTYSNSVIIHHAIPIHMVNTTFVVPFISNGFQTARMSSFYSSRFALLNVLTYLNMTFREEDIIEVDLGGTVDPGDGEEGGGVIEGSGDDALFDQNIDLSQNASAISQASVNCCSQPVNYGVWIFLILQFFIMLTICAVTQYRVYLSVARIEKRNLAAVSFSVSNATSQMTLADK